MNHDLPALPDDIAALLDKAKHGAPAPPPGAELAILAKVTSTAAVPVAATIGVAKIVAGVVVAAVIGTGVAVTARSVSTSHTAPVQPAPVAMPIAIAPTRIAVPATTPPIVDVAATPEPTPTPAPAPIATARSIDRDDAPSTTTPPTSEEELLVEARDALARGDGDVALKRLQVHAAFYKHGRLVEERRALTVVAFSMRGDKARATAAARAFEREYPQSLFLETVRAAVGP